MPENSNKRRFTKNVQEFDSLKLFRSVTKNPIFIRILDFFEDIVDYVSGLGIFVKKSGDSMQGNLNMQQNSQIEFFRLDGNKAGVITPDDPNQFGFGIAGVDNDSNLANVVIGGNNVYIGDNSIYFASNGTLPYGYLKLAGEPVLDSQGRAFYPIQFQQIEQELYKEEFTDGNQYNLSSGDEVKILDAGALVNGYSDPADYSYSFRLEETSNRSTEIEYWFEINGVEAERFTTSVGAATIVTVTGGNQILSGINAGDIITLWVQALDIGQGRNTLVRGDETDTMVSLRQLGFGVSSGLSGISISGSTKTLFPQGEVWFEFSSTGTYTLPFLGLLSEKNFFINCKNLSGGDITIKTLAPNEIYHSFGLTSEVEIGDGANLKLYVGEDYYQTG